MLLLVLVSVIWAVSFGLTKGELAGLDSGFISAARLGLATLVFLPFFRPKQLGIAGVLKLAGIGAIQFGLMYLAYNESYKYLAAYEVALFTLTTPLLVVLIDASIERRISWIAILAAMLSVAAAGIVTYREEVGSADWVGFGYVQAANACFALGQILYRRYAPSSGGVGHFGALYLGAFVVTLLFTLVQGGFRLPQVSTNQAITLVYLGVLASGFCFFWWNRGAKQVGPGTLAVMNNAKVPLAVAASLVIFQESVDGIRLAVAFGLLGVALLTLRFDGKATRGGR